MNAIKDFFTNELSPWPEVSPSRRGCRSVRGAKRTFLTKAAQCWWSTTLATWTSYSVASFRIKEASGTVPRQGSVFKTPVVGPLLNMMGHVPVDRIDGANPSAAGSSWRRRASLSAFSPKVRFPAVLRYAACAAARPASPMKQASPSFPWWSLARSASGQRAEEEPGPQQHPAIDPGAGAIYPDGRRRGRHRRNPSPHAGRC